jgi:ABC-type multidrug transport system ATPase subunit
VLTSKIEHDAGSFEWGHQTHIGYFAQDHRELLDSPKLTPLNYVWEACPAETTSYVRGQLGRMLFSGDDVDKPASSLSGGEAARVIFTRLAVERPNVLILDEPTNHLDLETIESLTDALKKFDGTLLFVSHDRHFVGQLATRIIELRPDGLHDFRGTYDEYIAREGDDHLDTEAVVLKAKKSKRDQSEHKQQALTREERKKLDNRRKSLPKRRDELLEAISYTEAEKAQLAEGYSDPKLFENSSPEELKRLESRQRELDQRLDELMRDWESVEEELAELGDG